MTYPLPPHLPVDFDVGDGEWNLLTDAANMAVGAFYYDSSGASISNDSNYHLIGLTTRLFDVDIVNSSVAWSAAHPSRVVFNYPRRYFVDAKIEFPVAAGGSFRAGMLRYNAAGAAGGGTELDRDVKTYLSGFPHYIHLTGWVNATAGSYVEIFAAHNATAGVNLATGLQTSLAIALLA